VAAVARLVSRAPHEPARTRELVHDVDAAAAVDGEEHVDAIAAHALYLADDAVEADDRHIGPHFAPRAIDDEARHAEELGQVLAHDLRADEIAGHRFAQAEEPLHAPELDLVLLEPSDAVAKARVLVLEALVIGLHLDEVDVVAPEVRHLAREQARDVLDGRRDAHDGPIDGVELARIADARAKEEEGDRQQKGDDERVPVAAVGIHESTEKRRSTIGLSRSSPP
jgi:hypothetical protein